jgi:N-acetylmuramoyl-L-alanine amidase
MVVLHYTGMADAASALDRLCDPTAQVSAHYLIDEEGAVCRLVAEDRRAWHAGVSFWSGDDDVNSRSIGIELANPGHGPEYRAFPKPQVAALTLLLRGIFARHAIPARHVLGHSDVAVGRKRDPGELFDWRGLAGAGFGLWSEATELKPDEALDLAAMMRRFGYADATPTAIAAFQMHFRPRRVDGVADAETTARLADLLRQAEGR